MNLQEKLDALPWWNRPINNTSYHCDDLAKIVLAADAIVHEVYQRRHLQPTNPLGAWFTEYNPSRQAHKNAAIWADSKGEGSSYYSRSALVKTTRYSQNDIVFYPNEMGIHGLHPSAASDTDGYKRFNAHWFASRYLPQGLEGRSGHYHYQMCGIVAPTIRHFDREDPTDTIRIAQGQVPLEVIRQAVMYLIVKKTGGGFSNGSCNFSRSSWSDVEAYWELLAPEMKLRFDRSYRVKTSILNVRQHMVYFCEQVSHSSKNVQNYIDNYKREHDDLLRAAERLKTAEDQHRDVASKVSNYLLDMAFPKALTPVAKATTTEENRDA